jgi:hypothetical protein
VYFLFLASNNSFTSKFIASSKIISFFLDTSGLIPLYSLANFTFAIIKSRFDIFSTLVRKSSA